MATLTWPRAIFASSPPPALTPGGDGLDALRRIVAGAGESIRSPGGTLVVEHGYDQSDAVRALFRGGRLRRHRRDEGSRRNPARRDRANA